MNDTGKTYWDHLESLFHGALALPVAQRAEWVREHCAQSPEMVHEVLELLATHESEGCRVGRAIATTAQEMRSSQIIRRLGPYRIVERLGQGGMGTVYLAERDDHTYHQQVAIKLIRGFPGDAALERMHRERQILADLTHPHIARLLDGGNTEDGQPYLVMEYIRGDPIVQWCQEHRLEQRVRIGLFLDICNAVHYAHQHLVIHRDIKPGNVLVTAGETDGGVGRAVLLDFGIARFITEPGDETRQTMAFYTPGYASPEQLSGKSVTTASDIYSLGRLLMAILEVDAATIPQGDPGTLRRPEWQRQLPRDLAAIIECATSVAPQRRYPTVAALHADLAGFLEGRAVQAVPSSFAYRFARFAGRHRSALVAASIGCVIGLGLLWQWIGEYQRARHAEMTAFVEAENARQVLNFLLDTIAAAAPEQARGEEVTVRAVIERGHRGLLASPDMDPAIKARLLLALGEVYQHLEAYDDADRILEHATHSNDPDIRARALSLLGYGRIQQQRFADARQPLEHALALADGLSEEYALSIRNHWALWLLGTGQTAAAHEVFSEVIEAHRHAQRPRQVARVIHNLALAERGLGNLDRSADLLRESLRIKEGIVGRGDPSYALTQQLLAVTLRQQGDYEGAREAVSESLASRIVLYGEDHPGLHHDYNELANAYHDLGDFGYAIELYEKALERIENADRISRAVYLNNLAMALEDRGDWHLATPVLRESLMLREAVLGVNHATTAVATHNLARNLVRLRQLEEAESLIGQTLEVRRRMLGPEHQAYHYSRTMHGAVAFAKADWRAAESVFRDALHALTVRLPESNLWVLVTQGELARSLIELGELEEAADLLEQAVSQYRSALGETHPHAAALELELARIELLLDRSDNAAHRMGRIASTVENGFAPGSVRPRQLACLQNGHTGIECWSH